MKFNRVNQNQDIGKPKTNETDYSQICYVNPDLRGCLATQLAAESSPNRVTIENSGDDLPDIRIMYQGELAGHLPATIDLSSTTKDTLPDGTKAVLKIKQVGATNEVGVLVFSREVVDIKMAD